MSEPHYRFAQRFSSATEQRLEEIRQILREAEPIPAPSALERLDTDAIEDRRVFKRRFGYDWSLRFHREALVRLRRERDWTDGEVKLFLLSGTLRCGPFGVRPDASIGFALFGGILAAAMVSFALIGIFFILRSASPLVDVVTRSGAVMLVYSTIVWLCYQLYVRPWRIQRR